MLSHHYLQQNPQKYSVGAPFQSPPPRYAAKGGNIDHFPRKNGPINGPGTGTSDDIPAMLSDGEFVMTVDDVTTLQIDTPEMM